MKFLILLAGLSLAQAQILPDLLPLPPLPEEPVRILLPFSLTPFKYPPSRLLLTLRPLQPSPRTTPAMGPILPLSSASRHSRERSPTKLRSSRSSTMIRTSAEDR